MHLDQGRLGSMFRARPLDSPSAPPKSKSSTSARNSASSPQRTPTIEVHVFEGKVDVRSLNPLKEKRILTADQSISTDAAGRLRPLPSVRDKFLRNLPSEPRHLHFSFDSETAGNLTVEGSLPAARNVSAWINSKSPASTFVPGISGNALSLNGKNEWVETDWPGTARDSPRSVSFWIRIAEGAMPGTSQPAIIGWGDDDDLINGKWKVWAKRGEGTPLHLRISFGAQNYDSKRKLDDGEWHHIAVVYEGTSDDDLWPSVRAWMDGSPLALEKNNLNPDSAPPLPVNTLVNGSSSRPLRIGLGLREHLLPFEGQIDELRIYEQAISESHVKTLSAGASGSN